MTGRSRVLWGAWVLGGALTLAAVHAWWTAIPPAPPSRSQAPRTPTWLAPVDTTTLAAARRVIQERDPFRLARKPSSARYIPWAADSASVTPPSKPARPVLALEGVLGGPPWNVVVQGIPGRDHGVVLQVGEEVGGIRVRSVRGDTVVLAGQDTTWVLTPKRAWP